MSRVSTASERRPVILKASRSTKAKALPLCSEDRTISERAGWFDMGMIFSLRVGDSLKCGINSANGVSGGMQVMIVAKGWSLRGRGFRPPCRLVPPSAVFSCRIPEILFSKNTYVLDFPEAARRKLVKVAESCRILKPE